MIKIDAVGIITEGPDAGRYVKIIDASETGGYLILTAADQGMKTDGYDCWVIDFNGLNEFFEDSNWIVEWSSE